MMDPVMHPIAARIAVVGSLNMDLVLQVRQAPGPGETVLARALQMLPGGKGGNQAVACARQGAAVQMFGCVGDDAHGHALRTGLDADGIDHSGVQTDPTGSTGVAMVTVEATGQNRIIVVPGANGRFRLDAQALQASLRRAQGLVLQFEIPLDQVLAAARQAQSANCPVLLNPSPIARPQDLPEALWPLLDTLVVNEVEAATLAGSAVASPLDAAMAAQTLRALGPRQVVVTLGAAGAVAADATGCRHHPGRSVTAVDTTAAGDTFLGALAVALAQQQRLDAAVRQGIRAAALCVQQPGAQPSIPTHAAVAQSPLPPDWIDLC